MFAIIVNEYFLCIAVSVARIILERRKLQAAFPSGSNLKQRSNKPRLSLRITSHQSFNLTFPHHVHSFDTFERSFSSVESIIVRICIKQALNILDRSIRGVSNMSNPDPSNPAQESLARR